MNIFQILSNNDDCRIRRVGHSGDYYVRVSGQKMFTKETGGLVSLTKADILADDWIILSFGQLNEIPAGQRFIRATDGKEYMKIGDKVVNIENLMSPVHDFGCCIFVGVKESPPVVA